MKSERKPGTEGVEMKGETIERRRDLPRRTFEFARRVVKLCQTLDHTPGVSRTLAAQLLRSACSVGANVEEGQGSQSRRDFIAKYSIACKEARERLTIGFDFLQQQKSCLRIAFLR